MKTELMGIIVIIFLAWTGGNLFIKNTPKPADDGAVEATSKIEEANDFDPTTAGDYIPDSFWEAASYNPWKEPTEPNELPLR